MIILPDRVLYCPGVEAFKYLDGESEVSQTSEVVETLMGLHHQGVNVVSPCQILSDVDPEAPLSH